MEKLGVIEGRKANFQQLSSKYGIVIALIAICAALSIATPNFMTVDNVVNVLRQVSINGILAIGMTFVVITGGIDLSVGSLVAFSGVIVASFVRGGFNILFCMLLAVVASTILGSINGFFVANQRLAPFIVTLAMMTVGRGLTYVYSDGKPISPLTQQYMQIGKGDVAGIPVPVLILLVVFLISFFILNYTSIGRYIYAVGGNEHAALVSGINVNKIKLLVYAISGFLSGIAAIVLSARVSAGLPTAGSGYELDAIAAVVIGGTSLSGGKGRLWGTIIGILIIGIINNGLDLLNVSSYYQQIVKGCIILGAVLLDRSSNKQ
ncbi:MAG TPA: ribose ABC transporter permease [Clostridia bacterium]|nr:ribose ABC transporter permease [Clostridia bacterium]